jgi:hypothetical protein
MAPDYQGHVRGTHVARFSCVSPSTMDPTSLTVNEGFDRLERLLLAMHAGDTLSVSDTASVTGLAEHTCRAVFEGLERAGLMARGDEGVFVRKTLDVLQS